MFVFRKKDTNLYSPTEGKLISLSKVNDKTFSSKLLGDGFAVIPEGNEICAPCDGTIVMLFPSLHAFGIRMSNGIEVLIHVGINTVSANGKGFKAFKKVHESVKKGQKVLEIDKKVLKNFDLTTMVVLTNDDKLEYNVSFEERNVKLSELIIQRK